MTKAVLQKTAFLLRFVVLTVEMTWGKTEYAQRKINHASFKEKLF